MKTEDSATNSSSTSPLVGTADEVEAIAKSFESGHKHVYYTGCLSLPTSRSMPTSTSEVGNSSNGLERSHVPVQSEISTTLGDFSFLPHPQYANYNRNCNKLLYLHRLEVNLSN
ncbi:unnamed protein product, partial [Phytomonas sp. EM1]